MKFNLKETKWIIMDADRTVIAKGVPRSRYLISVDDTKDKKRVLYYDSKNKAESAFKVSGFYSWGVGGKKFKLEAVEVILTIEEVSR